MTALDFFEEYRFVLELLAAELLYLFPFAQVRPGRYVSKAAGFALLLYLPFCYRLWLELAPTGYLRTFVFTGWYTFIMMVSLLVLHSLFEIRWADLLFVSISAYATQHLAYVAVNECLALGAWPELTENLFLYAVICVAACVVIYGFLWFTVARRLRGFEVLLQNDPQTVILYVALLVLLIFSCFMCQRSFRAESAIARNYYSAISDVITCTLILSFQYTLLFGHAAAEKERSMERLMEERRSQYEMNMETVELLNRKCHDMKHQIAALRQCSSAEQTQYLQELDDTISDYAAYANTGNEALNTLLTEKSLSCKNKGVELTAIADGKALRFLTVTDLYALIGNALDNAIECVEQYADPGQRIVSLKIASRQNLAVIEVTNCFEGTLTMRDGLPVTSKTDKRYHGIGLRSIRAIAARYGGTMAITAEDGLFTLQIVLPGKGG